MDGRPAPGIAHAVAVLRAGGLVAFPTETVYGLGADATNPSAVSRLYAVKGRPAGHPVIVHLADTGPLPRWARDVPSYARLLAQAFWPGPLTMILKRAPGVPDALTGGQDTIGLRVPAHPLALELLRAFGGAIAAPSANRFGKVSPTTAAHVREDLGADVDLVLDGGPCEVGIESTIVDCSGDAPAVLRPGRIRADEIAAVTGVAPGRAPAAGPRAPGTLAAHYAPAHRLRLVDRDELALLSRGGRYAVLAFSEAPAGATAAGWVQAPEEAARYAHDLYANLRALDALDSGGILVETPPEGREWEAARDRLSRAARG